MVTVPSIPGLSFKHHQYGSHRLQRLGVWQPTSSENTSSGYWLIFIHGGAWRDPKLTLQTFVPSIKHMVSSKDIPTSAIKGFISLDYRLSTASSDSADGSAPAIHPDHILDIRSALNFLRKEYYLTNDYILAGHSAGATLSFQLLMGEDALAGQATPLVPVPSAVIGISGIYDLIGLDDRHDGYTGFISGAFGNDREAWKIASPVWYSGSFQANWTGGRLAILAWSPQDSLVDEPEIDLFASKLAKDGVNMEIVKDLHGEHDFVWEDGSQVAQLFQRALAKL